MNASGLRALTLLLLLVNCLAGGGPARAAVTVVNFWRMGENDAGAAVGGPVATTVDAITGALLTMHPNPVLPTYIHSISEEAAASTGSSLAVNLPSGTYGTASVIPNLTNNFGLEMWVRPANTTGRQYLAMNGTVAVNGWGFYQNGNTFAAVLGGVVDFGSGPLTVGEWTHLAIVCANGETTFFVNGVAYGTTNAAVRSPTGVFRVGSDSNGAENFTGDVDEARVFTFAPNAFAVTDLLINQVLTVTVDNPGQVVGPAAVNGIILLNISPLGGSWIAASTAPWLHPVSLYGTTSTVMEFTCDTNLGPTRSGTLNISGQIFTVTQTNCLYVLGTTNLVEGPAEGMDSIAINVSPANGPWVATTTNTWLHLVSPGGSGSTNVSFTFDGNTGPTRGGTLMVGGQMVAVTQTNCLYTLGTTSLVEGPAEGMDSIAISVSPANGPWVATTTNAWLHLVNPGGSGSTNMSFTFDTNVGTTRSGTVILGGQIITVTQTSYLHVLSTTNLVAGPASGADGVFLNVSSTNALWTASANASWLHVLSPSGTGSAYVDFTIDANSGTTRSGTLTLGGQTVTVTQASPSYVPAGVATLVSSGLSGPGGLAVDGAGNVYIADTLHGCIKEWMAASNTVQTLMIELIYPNGVALDSTGNLYIADSGTGLIKEWITASDTVRTLVERELTAPIFLAVDAFGNLYVSNYSTDEYGNGAIYEWFSASNSLSPIVSGLLSPLGVAVDRLGNVYFGEYGNGIIQELSAGSGQLNFVGPQGTVGFGGMEVDGAGRVDFVNSYGGIDQWSPLTGDINTPVPGVNAFGLAVDIGENIYFSDRDQGLIIELPHAYVNPQPRFETGVAGQDALPPVLPATANLTGPFAPVSDEPWLVITGVTNGVVSFACTPNSSPATRVAHVALLGQSIPIAQLGVAAPVLSAPLRLANGTLQFTFTNQPWATFSVLMSTNLALPLNQWTVLGPATNNGTGVFQFSTRAVAPRQFYRVSFP